MSPTRSRPARPFDLIRPETMLVGRVRELATGQHLLGDAGVRLLTLIGTGGVGKTRLAVELAERLKPAFRDGVRFVDLSTLRDPALLPFAVASALAIRTDNSRDVFAELATRLQERQVLLVLDNLEQVLPGVAEFARLLGLCPGLRLLATSREPLHLRAEQRLLVGPLRLPNLRRPAHEQAVDPAPAVQLFAQRARAIQADFALTDQNAVTVGEICTRLDGLPLAIELAAARLSVLTPETLLARLQSRLPLLRWRVADAPERHQALRTTFSWSYDLLDDGDRRVFRRLAVFSGSFSAELAAAMAEPDAGLADCLDALQRLVEKGLVTLHEMPGGEVRFGLLETIREFALECLAAAGELDSAQRNHALHLLAIAERTTPGPLEPEPLALLAAVDAEHPNLLGALDWAAAAGESDIELRLAGALGRFWWIRGYAGLGRGRLEAALECGREGPSEARARALLWCGLLAFWDGDSSSARAVLEEAVEFGRDLNDDRRTAWPLIVLGYVALAQSDHDRASAAVGEGLALARASGDAWASGVALQYLGLQALLAARAEHARPHLDESLGLLRRSGAVRDQVVTLTSLAVVDIQSASLRSARHRLVLALEHCRSMDEVRARLYAVNVAAHVLWRRGQKRRAAHLLSRLKHVSRTLLLPPDLPEMVVAERLLWSTTIDIDPAAEDGSAYEVVSTADLVDEAVRALADAKEEPRYVAASPPAAQAAGLRLSPRERQVLGLLADGLTTNEIAGALIVSPRTARYHVGSILGKLGATNRAQAVALGLHTRLIDASVPTGD